MVGQWRSVAQSRDSGNNLRLTSPVIEQLTDAFVRIVVTHGTALVVIVVTEVLLLPVLDILIIQGAAVVIVVVIIVIGRVLIFRVRWVTTLSRIGHSLVVQRLVQGVVVRIVRSLHLMARSVERICHVVVMCG